MGYNTRPGLGGHTIETYEPDDTEDTMYIDGSGNYGLNSIAEIIDKARQKWPGIELDQLRIRAEHIHTDCLGYDRYDASDYTNYICIERIK